MHGRLDTGLLGWPSASGLRIGVVLHDFALGGTERVAIRLANQWALDGAAVTLFAGATTGALRPLLDPRVTLAGPAQAIVRANGSVARLGRAAADWFRDHPVDVCFVPGNYHWPVAAEIARIEGPARPLIAVQVSAALHKPQRGSLRQVFYDARMRRLLAQADLVVTLCAAAAEEADAILRRADSLAIPLPALCPEAAAPVAVADGAPLILAAGRLVREKGFDTLIDAFARVAAADDAVSLAIVGEGPERAALEQRVARHGLQARIRLPGYAVDTRPWLDRARLFVLSSRFEGYGAVVIEALAAGRPVLATACTPAVAELLDAPEAGRAVPIEDVAAMAAALTGMLRAPAPAPDRLAARVGHHRIDDVARRYGDAFARGLALRGRRTLRAA